MDIKKKIRRKIELYNFKRNHRGLYVDGSLQLRLPKYISCGSNIAIGENSKLLCWDSYNGKKFETSPSIIIGSGVRITRNLTIQCANRVQIGDNVLIASDVFIIDYNHGNSPLTKNYRDNPLNISGGGGVTIENGVWIGNNYYSSKCNNRGKKYSGCWFCSNEKYSCILSCSREPGSCY